MKYLLLVYLEENALSEAERDTCYRESTEFAKRIQAEGCYLAAAPLQPTATATSLRVRSGKAIVTDGPFAETREQLGGFFMIDVPDLDEAIRIAAQVPAGRWGTVEIRPLVEIPDLPQNLLHEPVDLTAKR